jgi:hypothetical protein
MFILLAKLLPNFDLKNIIFELYKRSLMEKMAQIRKILKEKKLN